MSRTVATIFATVLSALGIATASADESTRPHAKLVLKAGDLIVQQDKNGWAAVKILAIDSWPDGSTVAHCLTYKAVATKPTSESLRHASVLIWHAPIDAASFEQGWERIGNEVSSKEELVGFAEYLKLTDFPRYIALTGQDPNEIVREANEHYKRAHALGEQGNRIESIAEYGRAIDLFPLFYEAIDNRAFTFMELGKFREALHDFELSLRVNPEGLSAFFSRGECLMKLGHLDAAQAVFQEGEERFPKQRAMFSQFLAKVQALKTRG